MHYLDHFATNGIYDLISLVSVISFFISRFICCQRHLQYFLLWLWGEWQRGIYREEWNTALAWKYSIWLQWNSNQTLKLWENKTKVSFLSLIEQVCEAVKHVFTEEENLPQCVAAHAFLWLICLYSRLNFNI